MDGLSCDSEHQLRLPSVLPFAAPATAPSPVIARSVSAEAIWCSSGLSPFCHPEALPKDLLVAGHEAKNLRNNINNPEGFSTLPSFKKRKQQPQDLKR